jgi:hypothetical protein
MTLLADLLVRYDAARCQPPAGQRQPTTRAAPRHICHGNVRALSYGGLPARRRCCLNIERRQRLYALNHALRQLSKRK